VSSLPPTQAILEQVRAVRRRNNGHLLQQAAARWLLVTALAAALVVVAALRGGRLVFGCVLLLGASAAIGATVVVARQIRAHWLRARDAAARIDRARELRGRLASVVELQNRASGGFFELLAEQNVDALPGWRPEDMVPRLVSSPTLAAACAAVAALVLVIVFAPWLRPPPPRVLVGDRPMDFVASNESRAGADRLVVSPGTEHHPAATAPDSGGKRSETESEDSTLATWQEWLQDTLGAHEHWQTDDGEVPPSGSRQDTTRNALQNRDPNRDPSARPVADGRAANAGRELPGADGPATPRPGDGDDGTPDHGGAAPGAGSETDPNLYGDPHDDVTAHGDRFELAIAARVRMRPGSAEAHWTDTPGADPSRRPALAVGQRPEQAAHRMIVPPTFAPIVRRLFAHAEPAPGASP
jgi:hypothetical protein